MLRELEQRLVTVLGADLPAPLTGRVRARPGTANGAGAFAQVAVRGLRPVTPDFGAIRPEVAPGAPAPRRVMRLEAAVDIRIDAGAGGDRDQGKRPMMGQAAAEGADVVFVTDDNPRSEDPAAIRAAVMASCPNANEIGDRAEAILAGVDALQPGDALLIAGKGHETGQIVGQDIFPFDDAEQASIAVAALDGLEA